MAEDEEGNERLRDLARARLERARRLAALTESVLPGRCQIKIYMPGRPEAVAYECGEVVMADRASGFVRFVTRDRDTGLDKVMDSCGLPFVIEWSMPAAEVPAVQPEGIRGSPQEGGEVTFEAEKL